jgi:broad specificity phosphatase PhoE
MKTTLIFVRHAEAIGNVIREFHGWRDSEITEKGHQQAKLVAKKLKDIPMDVLYSSSMKRTLQTAQYISDLKQLPIIRTDKLKEINGGDWEGKKWSELPELYPNEHETWENKPHIHQMPNGESMKIFQDRLLTEVMKIIADNEGKNIGIVTHGTAIKAMMCRFYHKDLEDMINISWYDNTSVTVVEYEDDKFNVINAGDNSHLTKEMSTIENQPWWEDYKDKVMK